MKYEEYEIALSVPRIGKYRLACNGDKNKALILYDKIRTFRNRIAHHEPLCFDSRGLINLSYAKNIFSLIVKYIDFLGYKTNELLYGVENPLQTIDRIDKLSKT